MTTCGVCDNAQEDCVVMVDDDLRCVWTTIGKQRPITDPAAIWQIITNTHATCCDLGITVFCWSRAANPKYGQPELHPIRLVAPISSAYGIRGAARERRFDVQTDPREDLDFTLQTLLVDRILFADMRFYWDFGRDFAGRGGNVGLAGPEKYDRANKVLREKWGDYIGWKDERAGKKIASATMQVCVERMNPLAHHKYWTTD